MATFNETKREAIDVVAKQNTGSQCIGFQTDPADPEEYLGQFTFKLGEPATLRFWRNKTTGNLLYLDA